MGNWSTLKKSIANVIKTNGNQEITGLVLQQVLVDMISFLGENATFVGFATPSTNPGLPDGPVYYFAFGPGTYSNFSAVTLDNGFWVLKNKQNGDWEATKIFSVLSELGDSELYTVSQKYLSYIFNSGYQFKGIANASTKLDTIDIPCFFIAQEKGVYKNFLDSNKKPIEVTSYGLNIIFVEKNGECLLKSNADIIGEEHYPIITLTEEEYDALTEKDQNKLYFIYED